MRVRSTGKRGLREEEGGGRLRMGRRAMGRSMGGGIWGEGGGGTWGEVWEEGYKEKDSKEGYEEKVGEKDGRRDTKRILGGGIYSAPELQCSQVRFDQHMSTSKAALSAF